MFFNGSQAELEARGRRHGQEGAVGGEGIETRVGGSSYILVILSQV